MVGDYIIKGDNALLSFQNEELEIHGIPASIKSKSNSINGSANLFKIYPNKSMEMIGNARLINQGNTIISNLITYQFNVND